MFISEFHSLKHHATLGRLLIIMDNTVYVSRVILKNHINIVNFDDK
ncbi:Uncharacterised protein [Salmonella bongori]|nr:Uncharacterised protein [Salmonella bongori]